MGSSLFEFPSGTSRWEAGYCLDGVSVLPFMVMAFGPVHGIAYPGMGRIAYLLFGLHSLPYCIILRWGRMAWLRCIVRVYIRVTVLRHSLPSGVGKDSLVLRYWRA